MGEYSKEQIAKAKSVPLIDYLEAHGYSVIREGHYARLEEHDSFVILLDENRWIWNSEDIYGDTIDFLILVEKKTFRDAVHELIGDDPSRPPIQHLPRPKPSPPVSDEPVDRTLPRKCESHKRVYAYLTQTRCIAPSIVRDLLEKNELYEATRSHNAVFVRYVDGVPRYCFQRGTSSYSASWRGETAWSEKDYAWCRVGENLSTIYVFEAVIDALSYATLVMRKRKNWHELTLITLGGRSLAPLYQFLSDHPQAVSRIVVCTDNDNCGNKTAANIQEKFSDNYTVLRSLPSFGKDWNDTLCHIYKEKGE